MTWRPALRLGLRLILRWARLLTLIRLRLTGLILALLLTLRVGLLALLTGLLRVRLLGAILLALWLALRLAAGVFALWLFRVGLLWRLTRLPRLPAGRLALPRRRLTLRLTL